MYLFSKQQNEMLFCEATR